MVRNLGIALGVAIAGALLFGAHELLGGFDIAADSPHGPVLLWLAATTRANAIAANAQGIALPPQFGSDAQVRAGASEYAEMCAQCHLGPGIEPTEISRGLYPAAPHLAREGSLTPPQQFWVIKHGIKMTGMAAWGPTHSDKIIWSIVAFLQKLPKLSPQQYRDMTKDAAEDHDTMGHMPGMEK